MTQEPPMTVRGVYDIDITPSKRAARRCQRYLWVRSCLVDMVVSFASTRKDCRCSCEDREESTCERHGLGFAGPGNWVASTWLAIKYKGGGEALEDPRASRQKQVPSAWPQAAISCHLHHDKTDNAFCSQRPLSIPCLHMTLA